MVFTSKDQGLNKAHVQRLESLLVELAREAKRCVLDNGNVPQPPSLTEADTADVEGFLDDVLLCLPTLGYLFFDRPEPLASTGAAELLFIRARGIEARGMETPQGFLVYANSTAARKETASCHTYLRGIRAELIQQDVLRDRGEVYELTQDYSFPSPSTAAGVLLGRSANGRTEWAAADGRTLKSIQAAGSGA